MISIHIVEDNAVRKNERYMWLLLQEWKIIM